MILNFIDIDSDTAIDKVKNDNNQKTEIDYTKFKINIQKPL